MWSTNLQRQQTFVDLCALETRLSVGARRVRPSLVPRQVDEREFTVHFAPPAEDNLKHGVTAGRVSVSRGLSRRPEEEHTQKTRLIPYYDWFNGVTVKN